LANCGMTAAALMPSAAETAMVRRFFLNIVIPLYSIVVC
jgi:hypothetical protein